MEFGVRLASVLFFLALFFFNNIAVQSFLIDVDGRCTYGVGYPFLWQVEHNYGSGNPIIIDVIAAFLDFGFYLIVACLIFLPFKKLILNIELNKIFKIGFYVIFFLMIVNVGFALLTPVIQGESFYTKPFMFYSDGMEGYKIISKKMVFASQKESYCERSEKYKNK